MQHFTGAQNGVKTLYKQKEGNGCLATREKKRFVRRLERDYQSLFKS
jgi:hypothetical protein